MKRMSRRAWITLTVVAVAALAAFGAYAYWTAGGSGSGSATTGTTTSVTVNQTSTVSGMYPGGPTQALSGNFNNPNAGSVFVGTVAVAVDSGWNASLAGHPDCTAADFQVNGSPVAVNAEIPSGTGVGAWSGASIQMLNTAADQDACKNASVPLVYTVNHP